MSVRENYLATMRFEPCPRTPRWELGFWSGAINRWYEEGLPGKEQSIRSRESDASWVSGGGIAVAHSSEALRDHDVADYFGLDRGTVAVEVNYNNCPQFETVILEETDDFVVRRDGWGIVSKVLKPERGMPLWLDYPVHNRQEWERFKAERYQPDLSERVPDNWETLLEDYRDRDYPLCVGLGATGYFGTVRQILGLERTLTTFCDDPAWMHDMMDYLADFYVSLYDQILSAVKVDYAAHWEDMCYVAGPLISPRMFGDFMLEPYKRLSDLLRDHGIDVFVVDTDGDAWQLLDLFIEGGITGMYPFEVQSKMDVGQVRKRYPRLALQGGIDKKALVAGKEAIDRELEAKVPVAVEGGYIPHIDHASPSDISWENFCYYRRKLDAMLDEIDAKRWRTR